MKRFINSALIILILIATASCSKTTIVTKKPASLPPGQMKKVTGSKSAAPYAQGQQKKGGKSTAPGQKKKQ